MTEDIRWEQRFSNFVRALHKLTQAVEYINQNTSQKEDEDSDIKSEIIKEGLIQRFEYTHELAWKVMKDYALFQGNPEVGGSRDASREALQLGIISNGDVWMEMIGSRNKTSHTYNEDTADEIYSKILNDYYPAFIDFEKIMEEKKSGNQGKLL